MYCTNCGFLLEATFRACPKCGTKRAAFDYPDENTAPEAPGAAFFNARENVSALQLFIGPKQGKYLTKWGYADNSAVPKIGWNWGAFFFSYYWLWYRKMYKTAFAFLGIWLGIYLISFGSVYHFDGFYFIAYLITFFLSGIFGDYLYFNSAARKVEQILLSDGEPALKEARLKKKGGVSSINVLAGLLLFFLLQLLLEWFIIFIHQPV
ncbi:DUF2628 domain-containing protein [Alkalicoccus urumqiensis]|uniref:DUF2628 domain-containing protein n=1 Tax=Alkalicoccus urumqiensis TaxID=1548213 RepID=A0A2P6MHX3_ALKUR|nr:DUF2628 domain-containing protein [Alkalicoccus urumqiensis]PRO65876.1 hypothetical protein C6I21_08245 [Alkalicoccus urumqiensis]